MAAKWNAAACAISCARRAETKPVGMVDWFLMSTSWGNWASKSGFSELRYRRNQLVSTDRFVRLVSRPRVFGSLGVDRRQCPERIQIHRVLANGDQE